MMEDQGWICYNIWMMIFWTKTEGLLITPFIVITPTAKRGRQKLLPVSGEDVWKETKIKCYIFFLLKVFILLTLGKEDERAHLDERHQWEAPLIDQSLGLTQTNSFSPSRKCLDGKRSAE